MNFSKSLTYSLLGTLLLIGGLSFLFGGKVLGVFLLLPLGLLFRSRKETNPPVDHPDFQRGEPIEPK